MRLLGAKYLSSAISRTGTIIRKFLEPTQIQKGFNGVTKQIIYSEKSKMVQDYGIFSAVIRDAGKQGKHVMILGQNKDKFIALGKTKPSCSFEQSIQAQLKEYIDAVKVLKYRS